jgi:hypothetical protein
MKATTPRTPASMLGAGKRRPPGAPLAAGFSAAAQRRPTQMGVDEIESSGAGASNPGEPGEQLVDSHIRDEEVFRMAAFRIRETANRIITLAKSTRSENLRRDLLVVCERLLAEETALLTRDR